MSYGKTLAKYRKQKGLSQISVAESVSRQSGENYTRKHIFNWEKGITRLPAEPFLLLCELYGIKDVLGTFRGADMDYYGLSQLNGLGRSRVEEYIELLLGKHMYVVKTESEAETASPSYIRLYDMPAAAGPGVFLDSDSYSEIEVDGTVPGGADYAVKVSGNSMAPRFSDGQIAFVKEQEILDAGDIGIFSLNGEAYIKKLGNGELLSLNTEYAPIKLGEYDSIRIFGRVVG
jgi:SOS-response transcriptional repressor LexA